MTTFFARADYDEPQKPGRPIDNRPHVDNLPHISLGVGLFPAHAGVAFFDAVGVVEEELDGGDANCPGLRRLPYLACAVARRAAGSWFLRKTTRRSHSLRS